MRRGTGKAVPASKAAGDGGCAPLISAMGSQDCESATDRRNKPEDDKHIEYVHAVSPTFARGLGKDAAVRTDACATAMFRCPLEAHGPEGQ